MAKKDRKPLGRGDKLEDALKAIRKKGLVIGSLADLGLDVEAVTTGNIAIDYISKVGGLPKGRIIELYGPPSSGKTTLALQAAARFQQAQPKDKPQHIAFFDYEYSLDPEYCEALGLDTTADTFLTTQPESFEQGMDAVRRLVETGEVGFIIVDSVAAMPIEKELEQDTGTSTFADKAKHMASLMRVLTGPVAANGVVCVFLNHIQEKIDTSPMGQRMASRGIKQVTTPGGKALKFHASVRVEFKPVGTVREERMNPVSGEKEAVPIETKTKVTFVKNKVGVPYQNAEVRVRYGEGFDNVRSVQGMLTAHGIFKKKSGGHYDFEEGFAPDVAVVGENQLYEYLKENPEFFERCLARAQAILDEAKGDEPAPDPESAADPQPEVAEEDATDVDKLLGEEDAA